MDLLGAVALEAVALVEGLGRPVAAQRPKRDLGLPHVGASLERLPQQDGPDALTPARRIDVDGDELGDLIREVSVSRGPQHEAGTRDPPLDLGDEAEGTR